MYLAIGFGDVGLLDVSADFDPFAFKTFVGIMDAEVRYNGTV